LQIRQHILSLEGYISYGLTANPRSFVEIAVYGLLSRFVIESFIVLCNYVICRPMYRRLTVALRFKSKMTELKNARITKYGIHELQAQLINATNANEATFPFSCSG